MKIKDLVLTANSNLVQSKARTALTVGAIFVGSFFLTLSLGFSGGAREFVRQQLEGIEMPQTIIVSKLPEIDFGELFATEAEEYNPEENSFANFEIDPITDEDISRLEGFEETVSVVPEYSIAAEYIELRDTKYNLQPSIFVERMEFPIETGSFENLDENSIVVGNGFARSLDTDPENLLGEKVTVQFENDVEETFDREFEIVGVLTDSILLNTTAFFSENTGLEFREFNSVGRGPNQVVSADEIIQVFMILDEDTTEDRIEEIQEQLTDEGYNVTTFEAQTSGFDSFIDAIQYGLLGFSMIVLLVSVFAIANTLLMSVYERTREIGLMKALGMKERGVFYLFALEAAIIGFWGSIAGIIGATVFGFVLNVIANSQLSGTFESYVPFEPNVLGMLIIIPIIMFVAFLAGSLPAAKASRLNPIDALRYE